MSNYHFFFKIKTTGFNMSNDKADLRDIFSFHGKYVMIDTSDSKYE